MATVRNCGILAALALAALSVPLLAGCGGSEEASSAAPLQRGTIAFKRYFDPAADTWSAVFTASADGSGVKQLTHTPDGTSDEQPAWATDGTFIVFTRCPSGALCHTYVMKADGTALEPIGKVCPAGATETSCADESNVTPSPDGKLVALTASTGVVKTDLAGEGWIEKSAITIMNLDGTGRRIVRQLSDNQGDLAGEAFSPDGKRLVFDQINSSFASRPGKRAVFVVDVDGSGLKQLTPWSENSGDNPDWSRDGNWIVFRSHVDEASAQSQYFVIRPDGTGRRQVTRFPAGTHLASASFSPDGKSLVISKGPEGGNIDVWTIRFDGSGLTRVTRSPRWESAPDWGTG